MLYNEYKINFRCYHNDSPWNNNCNSINASDSVASYAAMRVDSGLPARHVTSGENVYMVWAGNKTGHPEVMFRASADGGQTFNDKINLSNSSNADSTNALYLQKAEVLQ